jgi:hypothetical protein
MLSAFSFSAWLFALSSPTLSSSFALPPRPASTGVARDRAGPSQSRIAIRRNNAASSSRATTTTTTTASSASPTSDEDGDRGVGGRYFSFEEKKSLESRLATLEREAPVLLSSFYEPRLRSFSVVPGSVGEISVTSTCFALQAIFATGDCSACFADVVNANMNASDAGGVGASSPPPPPPPSSSSSSSAMIPIRDVVESLLRAEWREEDMFQVPLLLYTVLRVDRDRSFLGGAPMRSDGGGALRSRVRRLVAATIENRPRRRDGNSQPMSAYILHLTTRALSELVGSTPTAAVPGRGDGDVDGDVGLGGLPTSALPDGAGSEALLAVARCAEAGYNELCRQLAFRAAGDGSSFDAVRLAYSLLAYVSASEAMAGEAGVQAAPGEGPAAGTTARPPNRRLITAALSAFFDCQRSDGMWDQGQPIYKSFRRTGRDVGNAYVFATDTVGSLLDALPAEDFRPHLDGLRRTLGWIEERRAVEIVPDYCDPVTGRCYGRPLRGWASPHMSGAQSSSPVAWSTAQVLTCIVRMRRVVQRLLHVDVLEELRGKSNGGVPRLASWDRLLDTDLGDPASADRRTLKDVLDERMIRPFSDAIPTAGTARVPKVGVAYSAILFGPPGTAKTTICESLAERMGWDFVVIDTSNFLEDGLTNVASRIRYLFDRLRSLTNCVILFDEIEEFCLDRETPGLGMESRLLTTSMLTQLNDLRRAKKSVFFLATNRLRAFDSAIIRPGRFDMQLFVGTPNLESRVVQLRGQLASLPVSQSAKDDAEGAFRSHLASVWGDDAMFFNYLEGLQFASACADVVATGNPLAKEKMSSMLKAQAAVMTVRGAVREEYLASMGLSRL